MAGRFFGEAWARVYPIREVEARHVPSADVLKGMDDDRAVRKLRRRMQLWRLFRRVR
ncbi:MAG TPA: hypothetical protein VKE97_08905 [Acidimicrobiia bacterium]|nr:hypothetical protein [Acidimicrobiia bacterium]